MGRNSLRPNEKRINLGATVKPSTKKLIKLYAKAFGLGRVSMGKMIEALVEDMCAREGIEIKPLPENDRLIPDEYGVLEELF